LEEAKAKIEKMISEANKVDAQYKSDMKTKKEAEAKKKEAEAKKKKAEREDAQYKSDMKTKKEAEAKKKEAEAKKKKMEEAKDTEKATPADLERAKKINNHYNKKAKDDYDNTTRMIALARAGKIGPAKTKK
jgi:hypothetical protein